MNKNIIKEILKIYTSITKITTLCINENNLRFPLYTSGLDFSILLKYTNYCDVSNFLHDKFLQFSEISVNPNTLHTFYTKHLFIYHIVFMRVGTSNIALIAGPILQFYPTDKFIEEILKNNGFSGYQKYEFITVLNSLPLASNERIYELGRLLFELVNVNKSCNLSMQEIHGEKMTGGKNNLNDMKKLVCLDYEYNTYGEFYRFCIQLKNLIIQGNESGIIDLIGEYRDLFRNITSFNDNKALKNICIILYTFACNWSIQSNVPYEQIFHYLWKSMIKLDKLNSANEIILLMTNTLVELAHKIFILSDNNYSLHVNRMIHYIKIHYSEKITLKKLAEHIQINPVYLSSLIKKETNMSLSNHINFIRIEESKKLLIYTDKSIQDIAFDIGYNYENHFDTVFKKFVGLTPLEYRNHMGNKNYVPLI